MNNRQSGRRRGRNNNGSNNNRSQSGGRGGADQANRIDSRARGNAAQMIEKYRNLARDAQLSGDRVQTEYYLQFADHYFRVLSDFRARQEEKAAANGQERSPERHREIRGVEDFDGHDDSDFEGDVPAARAESGRDNRERQGGDRNGNGGERQGGERRDEDDHRGNRQPRERGNNRRDRDESRAQQSDAEDGGEVAAEEAAPAPRANRRSPRRARPADAEEGNAGIDTAVLPPAIGRPEPAPEANAAESADTAAEAPAPKSRRTRRTLAARDTGVEAAE